MHATSHALLVFCFELAAPLLQAAKQACREGIAFGMPAVRLLPGGGRDVVLCCAGGPENSM